MARPSLTRAHRVLLGLVAVGACLISGIGFAGSYSAVRELALHKGFGNFAYAFPIGVDAGIVVLLALDLVLTWLRIPFPLLRQTAWLLTVATIAFNAAASWGDPLGMGMHAVIPVLFVVVVEASRHAVGRIAAISADRHMESVRLMRWILSPVPTFRLWRRMKLWELRSYDEVVRLEQNRLVYRAQLRFRYGRGWRRSAPIQALLPLKLAKYGVPLDVGLLDRIDPPVVPAAAAAATATPTAERAVGQASVEVPPVSAAVAVPTLAKLAAARWRDGQNAQDPQEAAASPAGAEAPARPARPVTALRDIRAAVGQQEAAPHPVAETIPDAARPAGQRSPWFKAPAGAQPRPAQPHLQQQPQQQAPRPPQQRSQEPVAQQMPPQQRQPQPQQTQHQQPQPEPQPAPAQAQQRVEPQADGRSEHAHAGETAVPATAPVVAEAEPLPVAEAPVEEFPVPVAPAPEPAMDVFAPRVRAQNRPEALPVPPPRIPPRPKPPRVSRPRTPSS